MKKTFIASLIFGASVLTCSAQTEFRHIGFDEALVAAKQENKLVFIDFYTTWCGPCKRMSSQVFPQKTVGDYMNATFVPLKLDAENDGLELAKRYEIKSYPTYVIVDTEGKEVARFSGSMEADRFIGKLQASIDPEMKPERIKERYDNGERTPKLIDTYAMQLMEARKEEEGFKVIDDYFASLSDADRLKEENLFIFTTYTFSLDNDRARFMVAHRNDFAGENAPMVKERVTRLYNSELDKYFSGYMLSEGRYSPEVFGKLKEEMNELGLNKDNVCAPVYAFIEKRAELSDSEFLTYCENNYDTLDNKHKDRLMINILQLIHSDTPEICAEMSKFIRSHLSTMSPIAIQYAGNTLNAIEKTASDHKAM